MRQSVYIETTVLSYLTSRPSRDLLVAAHQQVTAEWWENGLPSFEAFISIQIAEKARGDAYHLAVSAYHGMDFLVSWNFGHILNPRVKAVVQQLNAAHGISTPLICTPEELLEA